MILKGMSKMNLKEQEYMLALGRHGSLTGAAQELWITQPTLSVFLNRLEKVWGSSCFKGLEKGWCQRLQGASTWPVRIRWN